MWELIQKVFNNFRNFFVLVSEAGSIKKRPYRAICAESFPENGFSKSIRYILIRIGIRNDIRIDIRIDIARIRAQYAAQRLQ